jgi:hypothetical protein
LAKQCEKELEASQKPKVVPKVIGDLSMIQLRESKKRTRPADLDKVVEPPSGGHAFVFHRAPSFKDSLVKRLKKTHL